MVFFWKILATLDGPGVAVPPLEGLVSPFFLLLIF